MTSTFFDPSRLNRAFTGIPTFLRSNYCPNIAELTAEAAIFLKDLGFGTGVPDGMAGDQS